MKKPQTISESLRAAITDSGIALLKLQEETGVQRASISRFLRGERSLRLDMADRLAVYFKLELQPRGK
jgi:plasmid maintenance system antidote protein VapI